MVSITESIFFGNDEIISITLPDTLHTLYGYVLDGCSNLKSVYLPENLAVFSGVSKRDYNYIVDKDSAAAKLIISAEGSYPSSCFIDPDYPDWQLYYAADALTGEPELGVYKYIGSSDTAVVPDGVVHLAEQAFVPEDYTTYPSLKTIRIPNSVTTIGAAVLFLQHVPALETLYLSENTSFSQNQSIYLNHSEKVYCPADSTTVRTMTSPNYMNIIDPDYPDFICHKFGYHGFTLIEYTGTDESIVIPDFIEVIDRAFSKCTSLKTIIANDTVKHVGLYAFMTDSGQTIDVYLPDHVAVGGDVGGRIFCHYDSETARNLCAENDDYLNPDDEFYDPNDIYPYTVFADPRWPDYQFGYIGDMLYFFGYAGNSSIIDIPPICDAIGTHVNLHSSNILSATTIIVPEGVTRLEAKALYGWPSLNHVSLPTTLTEIG